MRLLPFTLLLLFSMLSCSSEPEKDETPQDFPPAPAAAVKREPGCRGCHAMQLDPAHDFACITCHQGTAGASEKELAHAELIIRPAHPDNMGATCGKCHAEQVEETAHSLHFSLRNEVNRVRRAFGAEEDLTDLRQIPVSDPPSTLLDLTDDLLRRRCLRCHPYFSGDRYPGVVRGTGCAACHLQFYEGKLVSHSFLGSPGDEQCLQCHYGNRVGFDYYGRYEHDMNDEYRTPYTTRGDYFRPFGMEFHQLAADIHQQKGLVCIDCHSGAELMTEDGANLSCAGCHELEKVSGSPLPGLNRDDQERYSLLSKGDGKEHSIPLMQHPAHKQYRDVACQVCHGQWSFNDQQTNLLRSDLEEYDDFSRLSVQGSFEVERIIKNNLDFEAEELPHSMADKISGKERSGLWYKGFVTRRWENMIFGRDTAGTLQVMRPILDLHLSWLSEDEEVVFDAFPSQAENNGLLPYVPHTTGKAGLFYKERIERFLRSERAGGK